MRFLLSLLIIISLLQVAHADIRFLSISDIHYGHDNTPGDGHDTDDTLFALAMEKFSSLLNKIDFVITLGDFPTHLQGIDPKKEVYLSVVFERLYQANYQEKPMFYISGNNDSLLGNYQPFSSAGISPLSFATNWQGACAHCEGLLIDGTQMQEYGYYSSYVLPNHEDLILIALNSTQFVNPELSKRPYPHQTRDARQQLNWLKTQLQTHHAKHLLIAAHVPPGQSYTGIPSWKEEYLTEFIQLLEETHEQYDEISLLTAHTHMDEIRKLRLQDGKNIYAYATPSISRIHRNNPAMKIFSLNALLKLKDYSTYYTSHETSWGKEHYHTNLGTTRLFPQCANRTLAECMDDFEEGYVCKILQESQSYGVKSPYVDGSFCNVTYLINPSKRAKK